MGYAPKLASLMQKKIHWWMEWGTLFWGKLSSARKKTSNSKYVFAKSTFGKWLTVGKCRGVDDQGSFIDSVLVWLEDLGRRLWLKHIIAKVPAGWGTRFIILFSKSSATAAANMRRDPSPTFRRNKNHESKIQVFGNIEHLGVASICWISYFAPLPFDIARTEMPDYDAAFFQRGGGQVDRLVWSMGCF